jgi:hypothetical protein
VPRPNCRGDPPEERSPPLARIPAGHGKGGWLRPSPLVGLAWELAHPARSASFSTSLGTAAKPCAPGVPNLRKGDSQRQTIIRAISPALRLAQRIAMEYQKDDRLFQAAVVTDIIHFN